MAKPNIAVRAKPEDVEELKKLAAVADRTLSWTAANLISEALAARQSAGAEQRAA
jgi:predicted transcriptional regulator